jgi:hypothetical protein
MDIGILIKVLLVVIMMFLSGNFGRNKTTRESFAVSGYIVFLLLVLGGVIELANRFALINISFNITLLDVLCLWAVIYIVEFFIYRKKETS